MSWTWTSTPFCEARNNFEEFILGIAADAEGVAGVDEEDVIFGEGLKFR